MHLQSRLIAGLFLLALSLLSLPLGSAGDKEPVEAKNVLPDPSGYEFAFVMPGWLAGVEGTTTVRGIEAGFDAGIDDILKNLDMIATGGFEVRKGKSGFAFSGLYVDASVSGSTPGPLLSNVSVGIEQVLLEGTFTYRIFESDRAWIDVLAGARYTYMGTELSLSVDPAGVRNASQQVSATIFDRAGEVVRAEVNRRLPAILAGLGGIADDLPGGAVNRIEGEVGETMNPFRALAIRRQIEEGLLSNESGLGLEISESPVLKAATRAYIEAKVASELEEARAAASPVVSAARANARATAESRLARAEARLAGAIEKGITDRIPDRPVSASVSWVDPYVGFQGRYEIADNLYAVGRGDIGGFGVGSELTWNLYGAIGTSLSETTTMEIGYRYLYTDYVTGGFEYDAAMKGLFIGTRIVF